MDEVIKFGLVEQLRVLKIYLNDYDKELRDGILTKQEYAALRLCTEDLYERLVARSINKESEKEIALWLK